MQLDKVYFDAYKSLVNRELKLTAGCIGMVGINESGKSNVLEAINSLSTANPLSYEASPRMIDESNSNLRFEFRLNEKDLKKIQEEVNSWNGLSNGVKELVITKDCQVIYHVEFNIGRDEEIRYFTISGITLPNDSFVLLADAVTNGYLTKQGDEYLPLDNSILITEEEIRDSEKHAVLSAELSKINKEISSIESQIDQISKEVAASSEHGSEDQATEKAPDGEPKESEDNVGAPDNISTNPQIIKLGEKLTPLKQKKAEIETAIGSFDIEALIEEAKQNDAELEESIQEKNEELITAQAKLDGLEKLEGREESQEKELATIKRSLTTLNKKLATLVASKHNNERLIQSLSKPLRSKYSNNLEDLSIHLGDYLSLTLEELLPPVIYWKHTKKYILEGKTDFDEMMEASDLNDISRPLFNLFRISFDINSLEELQKKIEIIRKETNKRSTFGNRLNDKTNRYLKEVWPKYDQKIKISLEQDCIRVEFYDPKCSEPSHYAMTERSQGCQTFISFLLTIGAEAKQGIIKDTVLLLDEPEIHLHPSGVRYMLKELIEAANNGNIVIFATHSIFMIDRDNYDRHVIIKKNDERTEIQPSSKDRIGFFMQEEVLYGALDFQLREEFKSTNKYNFVFEGSGDAILFERFYDKALARDTDRPFKLNECSFYQGGKCSDILHYLKTRPIQLGTKWVFVLDSDEPALSLEKFIKSNYNDFLEKYVFIFKYHSKELGGKDIELEDLLPPEMIKDAIAGVTELLDIDKGKESLTNLVDKTKLFSEYFPKIAGRIKDKKEFKEKFKNVSNSLIEKTCGNLNNLEELEKKFESYAAWFKNVIEGIRDSSNDNGSKKGGEPSNLEASVVDDSPQKPGATKKKESKKKTEASNIKSQTTKTEKKS